jgi:hypothetical protein
MKTCIGIILLSLFSVMVFGAEDDWIKKANENKGNPNFNGSVRKISVESSRLGRQRRVSMSIARF